MFSHQASNLASVQREREALCCRELSLLWPFLPSFVRWLSIREQRGDAAAAETGNNIRLTGIARVFGNGTPNNEVFRECLKMASPSFVTFLL